jgi:hypothetical protein
MKKLIRFFMVVLSTMLTMVIASCDFSDFAMPESITIKGKPGLHVPLGLISNSFKVEDYLGTDNILKMMGGEEDSLLGDMRIYEYEQESKEVKTFLIHYQIAKMPYDLGQYMNQVYALQPPEIKDIDLRRPAEVARFFPDETLSQLLNMTDTSIEGAIDNKIDEWVDGAAAGETVNTGIPAAQSALTTFSTLIANPLLSNSDKQALTAKTKTDIKALQAVTDAKDTAKSQFSTFKDYAEELKQEVKIPLGDIAKLVNYIDVQATGLKVKGTTFEGKIEIAIPQFGIGSVSGSNVVTYSAGIVKDGDLYFTTHNETGTDSNPTTYKFTPNGPNLTVYINVKDFINGPVDFVPTLEFHWTEANVNPGSNGELKGQYDMDLGSVADLLGDDFEPPEVKGYLYIDNLPIDDPKMSLGINSPTNLINNRSIRNAGLPFNDEDGKPLLENGGKFAGTLPNSSLFDTATNKETSLDITNVLTSGASSSLQYEITMAPVGGASIKNNGNLSGVISADMVIVLPLKFTVKATPITGDPTIESGKYVQFDLKDENGKSLLPEITDDLFGREDDGGGTVDEILGDSGINNVKIILEKYVNNVLPDMMIWIKCGDNKPKLLDFKKDRILELTEEDFEYPFAPAFKILIPYEEDNKGWTLSVKDSYDFDFNLVVEATADLDKTIDL